MYLIGAHRCAVFAAVFLEFAMPRRLWNNKEALDRFPRASDISAPENFYFREFA
jgi:hypothetical protein